jgi:hypothetical protein
MTFRAVAQDENMRAELQDLVVPYWVFLCIATLASLISLAFGLHAWSNQIRARVLEARNSSIENEPTRRETLLAKIAAAKQTCIEYALAFLVGLLEARPRKRSRLPPELSMPSDRLVWNRT